MKQLLYLSLFTYFVIANIAYCQDAIYFKNGDVMSAKIVGINKTDLLFKRQDDTTKVRFVPLYLLKSFKYNTKVEEKFYIDSLNEVPIANDLESIEVIDSSFDQPIQQNIHLINAGKAKRTSLVLRAISVVLSGVALNNFSNGKDSIGLYAVSGTLFIISYGLDFFEANSLIKAGTKSAPK